MPCGLLWEALFPTITGNIRIRILVDRRCRLSSPARGRSTCGARRVGVQSLDGLTPSLTPPCRGREIGRRFRRLQELPRRRLRDYAAGAASCPRPPARKPDDALGGRERDAGRTFYPGAKRLLSRMSTKWPRSLLANIQEAKSDATSRGQRLRGSTRATRSPLPPSESWNAAGARCHRFAERKVHNKS